MNLTIITYHYVRPLANSRYPNLKGLDYDLFKNQIEYITKNYLVVQMEDVLNYLKDLEIVKETGKRRRMFAIEASNKPLALLAFDDGYIDHYTHVFPILQQYGIQGSFFIPVKPILENTVLDVNKIHYILESIRIDCIIRDIRSFIEISHERKEIDKNFDQLYAEYSEENRFDNKDIMFVKRFLQKWDNFELRQQLINQLFTEFVTCDREDSPSEEVLNQELYMNLDQIKHMHRAGMYIGGHTYNHYHLGSQTESEQKTEILKSHAFLTGIGCNMNYATLSYPYGSHNQTTKELLNQFGFKLGFSVDYGITDISTMDKFNLPRIDCNDVTKMMQSV